MSRAADVIDALKLHGFEYSGKTDEGWFKLHGRLKPNLAEIGYKCELSFDPYFVDLPKIQLLELPTHLPDVVPHLNSSGELCYLIKGSIVLDIYDPVGQTLACLQRANIVFEKILKGEMVDDLGEEFFAYWGMGMFCFVDIQGKNYGRQSCIVAKLNKAILCFVTDNEERTTRKLKSICCEITDKTILTYRVKTRAEPRPLINNWPPKTVGDILSWQSTLDKRCRRKINDRIREGQRKKANGALILVESPLITYGFVVLYECPDENTNQKTPINLLRVDPVAVLRIDDGYLAQRSIPGKKTLAGKKIAVVGIGTIGGYLSDMLVKCGAGTLGGKLTLVDFDFLLPQNIGRHRLGFSDLLSNKALAMTNELKRMAPAAEIRGLPVDIRHAELGEIDLLIDATGEESLGHWLCGHYRPLSPILTVWIEGPGTAVRALLQNNNIGACYRCLWHKNRRGELLSVQGSLPEIMAGHGCEGLYVPFPATVSVHAASLGAEMALDWANESVSPTLRTKVLDNCFKLATPDCDPGRDIECPICNS